jgi:hypothetical protein
MVGLVIACIAMVATVLKGNISTMGTTNTNHLAAISQLSSEDPCADKPQVRLNKVLHSNFGGKGPDSGAEGLVYDAVNIIPGETPQPLLLVINATNANIRTDPKANGFHGKYARLTVWGGTHIDATFKLLQKETLEPARVSELDITFFDLDTHSGGKAVESVQLDGLQQYFLTKNSQVAASEGDDGYTTFKATKVGSANDNPTDPLFLTVEQKDKAVTVRYINVNTFHAKLGVTAGQGAHRWFNFVLRPSLVCATTKGGGKDPDIVVIGNDPTTTVAPTTPTTTAEEEKKCWFVIPIINFCFPKLF